ncbi:superoxide dismutase family protein [Silvanigrella aquatica]|uniref:Superoxide dismutase copper/zinc binding domain-containing protein n=1 Tax=Silvanigrella aquatica TaxID=1915309 RepID=A0A1L4D0I3_9BACT|nr:superoxide dismutase family protein [Silvanigrella aquatica]APJ03697.1 hypothetical protein AXG55_07175 [Silvanigrella aquatica]
MSKNILSSTGIIFSLIMTSCLSSSYKTEKNVVFQPKNNSKASGSIKVAEFSDGGVHITGKISNLEPNKLHGFHIHEKGNCSDAAAMNAGAHYNPDSDHVHGTSVANESYESQHAGDLGNIKSNENGIALIDLTVTSPEFTLEKEGSKYSLMGKSFVVHADQDDEKSAPAGNAGKRILCGVVN